MPCDAPPSTCAVWKNTDTPHNSVAGGIASGTRAPDAGTEIVKPATTWTRSVPPKGVARLSGAKPASRAAVAGRPDELPAPYLSDAAETGTGGDEAQQCRAAAGATTAWSRKDDGVAERRGVD